MYIYTDYNYISSYRDFTTWMNKQEMPNTVSSRPDMMFSTKSFEIGNGEVKPANTPKASIDLARTRVLETCKRQLHSRLKIVNSLREAVTLVYLYTVNRAKKSEYFKYSLFFKIFLLLLERQRVD